MNDLKFIKLVNCDGYTVVDADLFDELNKYQWRKDNQGSVVRHVRPRGEKLQAIFLHRVVNQTPDECWTDHINYNRLDNRRCNLRSLTPSESARHRRKSTKHKYSSAHIGVTWVKARSTWQAKLHDPMHRTIHIGMFKDEEKAARAYDMKALLIYGDVAQINFPRENYSGLDLEAELAKLKSENFSRKGIHHEELRFRGVSFDRIHGRWVAALKHEGKKVQVGTFMTPADAARAYDLMSLKLRGPLAPTNSPAEKYAGLNLDAEIEKFRQENMRRRVELHRKHDFGACNPNGAGGTMAGPPAPLFVAIADSQ